MTLSVALMGHPARRCFIDELVPQLPGVEVVLDEKNDRWDTGRRSLLAFNPKASHHVVVQDDAIICKDFLKGVAKAVKVSGAHPVGLYVGRVRPHQHTITPAVTRALRSGSPWLVAPGPYWGVAIVIPTADIPELIAWADRRPDIKNYDRRVAAFYETRAAECWYTVPSLVDHRPVAENPSLVNGRVSDRRAHQFLKGSALDVDWTLPPTHVAATVVYRQIRTGGVRRVIVGSAREQSMARNPRWKKQHA